ncbi:MAG TPA: type II toxin-antitoxin system VapC family toxin [Granulicella sp.]
MVLVDTSIWIDHLRRKDALLEDLLEREQVCSHPFIIGELAVGSIESREDILRDMADLPQSVLATHDEVLVFIEHRSLFGRGIGYIDAHLLAATQLTPDTRLWTRDKRLHAIAAELEIAAEPSAH